MRPWMARELGIALVFALFVGIGVATVLIPGLRAAPDPAAKGDRAATKTQ